MAEQDERHDVDEGDGRKVLQRVVGHSLGVHDGIDRERPTRAHEQRVTVRHGIRHDTCPDDAARSAAVVDHHLLIELLGELLREHARENVARAAGR